MGSSMSKEKRLEIILEKKDAVGEKLREIPFDFSLSDEERFYVLSFRIKEDQQIDEILRKLDDLIPEDVQILNTSISPEKDSFELPSKHRISFITSDEIRSPNPNEIILKRGIAFGGFHPTTLMCLELIAELLKENKIKKALDLGAGSGILAIMAKMCGAKKVYAVEIDPVSCMECKENLLLNGYKDEIYLVCGNEACIKGKFDLIMTNIIFHTLRDLIKNMVSILEKRGFLILSGILSNQIEEFISILENGKIISFREREGWGAILWQKE